MGCQAEGLGDAEAAAALKSFHDGADKASIYVTLAARRHPALRQPPRHAPRSHVRFEPCHDGTGGWASASSSLDDLGRSTERRTNHHRVVEGELIDA